MDTAEILSMRGMFNAVPRESFAQYLTVEVAGFEALYDTLSGEW